MADDFPPAIASACMYEHDQAATWLVQLTACGSVDSLLPESQALVFSVGHARRRRHLGCLGCFIFRQLLHRVYELAQVPDVFGASFQVAVTPAFHP